jgi:predicted phosphodiesterase
LYNKQKDDVKQINEELVLCLSDWHIGENVSIDETNGINEYNVLIVRERISKMLSSVLNIMSIMQGYNYKKLNIFCLGDMVSGLIHEELLQGVAIVDQVMIAGDELTRIIRTLLEYFEEIEISCVVGNHGRMSKKPVNKKKYDNFDFLAYHFSKIRFENEKRVIFNIPESAMLIKNIQNYNFLLRHGDTKIQSYAGIPFYGIKRANTQIKQTYLGFKDIIINYDIMGHLYSQNTLDSIGGKIIMVGSLKGTDEFSLNTYMSGSNIRQLLFSVHREYGLTWAMDLHCQ